MQNPQAPASAPADPGFKLPGDSSAPAGQTTREADGTLSTQAPIEVAPVLGAPAADTSSRDLAIGGAVFLVLLIVYFFVRNAYVHHLVVKRVAPSTAGSAGWLLFVGLSFVSAAAVLALINASKFLTLAITAPLVAIGLVALGAALFVGRR
ncbi:hypothetical protein F2P45_09545 [Massilia sp. CCM 8733]|uniref:Uncharacterized protein n=1 Tax=Massilia mucilaginosa TaxID=2609282 RepID=A0ABX0NR80_9BURK|nr:hypothetical protein [Massilia mucilaginosa]NHZ89255.1 hypothetical protein [Massilia mucilaginosa]